MHVIPSCLIYNEQLNLKFWHRHQMDSPQHRKLDKVLCWHWTHTIPSVHSVHWEGEPLPSNRLYLAMHLHLTSLFPSRMSWELQAHLQTMGKGILRSRAGRRTVSTIKFVHVGRSSWSTDHFKPDPRELCTQWINLRTYDSPLSKISIQIVILANFMAEISNSGLQSPLCITSQWTNPIFLGAHMC